MIILRYSHDFATFNVAMLNVFDDSNLALIYFNMKTFSLFFRNVWIPTISASTISKYKARAKSG